MYKKAKRSWHKHFDFILFDIICMQIAYSISYMLRHGAHLPYEVSGYRMMAGIIALIDICVVVFTEGYRGILRRGYLAELKSVIKHVTLVILLAFSYMFFAQSSDQFSRIVFFYTWGFSVFLLYIERILLKKRIIKRMEKAENQREVVVITSSDEAEETIANIQQEIHHDFCIKGLCILDQDMQGKNIADIPVIASSDNLVDYLKSNIVDEVFLNLPPQIKLPEYIMESCMEMGITTHLNLRMLSQSSANRTVEKFGGYMVMTSSIKMASQGELFLKRAMDICGSIVGLLITAIATIFVAPIIYIQSPGPIFFSQERIGKNGRRFRIYKFRSMYTDAEERKKDYMDQNEMNGLMFKMKNDPRIFPFGKFIRKTSIDELPQFWNVLKGDMSLVGTRPPTVDEYEQYDVHHKGRLATKPGLTGMWQVSGRSDVTDFEEVVRMDTEYITKWSLGRDVRIIVKTLLVLLQGKGAS